MIKINKIDKIVKETLSKKRYTHTINVCSMAKELAVIYGVDTEKAEISALLHDIMKEKTRPEILEIFPSNVEIQDILERQKSIWHGPLGALYTKEVLGITDPEILDAIACHSTARQDMTSLDKVLFLADMVCEERKYKGLEMLRKLAHQDLDKAMIKSLEMNIEFIKEKGNNIDNDSFVALKWLKEHQI